MQTKRAYINTLFNKGNLGEYRSYCTLRKLIGYKKFLFNVYLPKDDGGMTEIDIIMLHTSGIYVFESKNYGGWIFGTETQRQWTQTLPRRGGGSIKHQFYNPIMQNAKHVKWLRRYLKQEPLPIYSFVVFSNRCKLKKLELTTNTSIVLKRNQLFDRVRLIAPKQGELLSQQEIDNLYEKMIDLTKVDILVKKEHIAEAKKMCPKCGYKLVVRTAKKGQYAGQQFWGCSNFPKCRYMENKNNS